MEEEAREYAESHDFVSEVSVKENSLKKVVLIYGRHMEEREYKKGKLGVAMPVNESVFFDIAEKFNKKVIKKKERKISFNGSIPKNLYFFEFENVSRHFIMFKTEPCIKKLQWKYGLEKYNGDYAFPEMIFVLDNLKLNIILKEGDEFFVPDFPNMETSNSMCMGSVKPKFPSLISYQKLLMHIESLFFDTYFSHELTPMFKLMKNEKEFPWQKIKKQKNKNLTTRLDQIFSTKKKK